MLRSWCGSSLQQSSAMSNPFVFGDIRVASAKTTGISLDVTLSFGGDSPTPLAEFGCFIPLSRGPGFEACIKPCQLRAQLCIFEAMGKLRRWANLPKKRHAARVQRGRVNANQPVTQGTFNIFDPCSCGFSCRRKSVSLEGPRRRNYAPDPQTRLRPRSGRDRRPRNQHFACWKLETS